MEIQLQELIDQIKKEGVDAAEAEAQSIVDAARAQAAQLVADAQSQADQMLRDARAESARITAAGEDALRQAGRNLLLSFRESVARELQAVVGENVAAVYHSDAFAALLTQVLTSWAANPDSGELTVLLNSDDLQQLEQTVLAALRARMLQGVTLKPDDHFDGGFRITSGDGGAYYDGSTESVAEMLSAYLSPRIAALLKEVG